MKKVISAAISAILVLILGAVQSVMAEAEAECEACYESITPQDVIYNDDGDAICIYCEEILSQEVLGTDLKMDVTREQFAAIAVVLYERITGKVADDSTENLPFTDCSPTGTYSRYVAAAYKLGITNGTSATTFAPSATITREQLATMLYRVILKAREAGIIENEMPLNLDEFVFDDDAQISEYAHESVYYMAKRGIIKGMSETEFAPQGVATKEQAILISNRIAENLY